LSKENQFIKKSYFEEIVHIFKAAVDSWTQNTIIEVYNKMCAVLTLQKTNDEKRSFLEGGEIQRDPVRLFRSTANGLLLPFEDALLKSGAFLTRTADFCLFESNEWGSFRS